MRLALAGFVPNYVTQSVQSGPVERRDGSAISVSYLKALWPILCAARRRERRARTRV